MNVIAPYKSQPELDADSSLAEFVSHCRIRYHGIHGSPRYVAAVVALADRCDAMAEQLQRAADSFRSLGCTVDADECEEAIRGPA